MTDRPVSHIRIATPEDATELGAMHVTSWRETYAGLFPEKMLLSLSVESRAAGWVKIMQEPSSTVVYLAEHENSIIGFGSCGPQRAETLKTKGYAGEVSAIYVLREFQKRKLGTRLMSAMSSDLQRRGFNAAALWVLRDNLKARRFYEHIGGKVIAEREDVRDGTILIELAYGWPDLKEMDRELSRE